MEVNTNYWQKKWVLSPEIKYGHTHTLDVIVYISFTIQTYSVYICTLQGVHFKAVILQDAIRCNKVGFCWTAMHAHKRGQILFTAYCLRVNVSHLLAKWYRKWFLFSLGKVVLHFEFQRANVVNLIFVYQGYER